MAGADLGDEVAAELLPAGAAQTQLPAHQAVGQLLLAHLGILRSVVCAKGPRGHELPAFVARHLFKRLATPASPAPGTDAAVARVVGFAVVIVVLCTV